MLEPRLRLPVAPNRRRGVIAGRHHLLEPAQLDLQLNQILGTREDVLAQGEASLERWSLVVQSDPDALLEGELAALETGLTHQSPEQRRLAGAIRAGQGDPVSPLDLERDAVEQRVAGDLLAEVGCDDHGHG